MKCNSRTIIPDRLPEKEKEALIDNILPILIDKGLKAATMDYVASALQMSKRTLYEVFGSKSGMIRQVLDKMSRRHEEFIRSRFRECGNTLDAMISIYSFHRDMMRRISANFFHDMDRFYKEERACYDKDSDCRHVEMLKIIRRGVEEGMFRPDVDYNVHLRIMGIQMESLKRTEEIFPPDIEFLRVYDAIIIGFLRSIVTPEGMKRLDAASASFLTRH